MCFHVWLKHKTLDWTNLSCSPARNSDLSMHDIGSSTHNI